MIQISNKKTIIFFIIIIVVQLITRIYIGNKKQYFHMDESYSYGLMNYNKINITDNVDFLNTWHNKEYYKDYLEINKNEIWDLVPIYENQKNDVHPPLYYLLLRVAATFSVDNFTKWTGIILNIIIFIVSSIFTFLLAKIFFKSNIYSLIVCIVNGFSVISLESSLYIRMYELTNLMVVLICYLHFKNLEHNNLKLKQLLFFGIVFILGGLTHYYFFIIALTLCICFLFFQISKKQYTNVIKYISTVIVCSVAYLIIFPYSINHILFSYRGINLTNQIIPFLEKLGQYIFVILGKGVIFYVVIIFSLIVYVIFKQKKSVCYKKSYNLICLGISILVYLIVISKNSPYVEIRYIIPIYSIITIWGIGLVKYILERYFIQKIHLIFVTFTSIIVIIGSIIINPKLEMCYSEYRVLVEKVKKTEFPIIYILDVKNNRFLDDIYLFTLAQKSIIIDSNSDYLKILTSQKGDFILIYNEGIDENKIKTYLENKNIVYFKNLNSAYLYFILNE